MLNTLNTRLLSIIEDPKVCEICGVICNDATSARRHSVRCHPVATSANEWFKHGISRYAKEPTASCLQCKTCKLYTGDIQGHLKHQFSTRHKIQTDIIALKQYEDTCTTAAASDVHIVDSLERDQPSDYIENDEYLNSVSNTTDNSHHEQTDMMIAAVLPIPINVSTTSETSFHDLVENSRHHYEGSFFLSPLDFDCASNYVPTRLQLKERYLQFRYYHRIRVISIEDKVSKILLL